MSKKTIIHEFDPQIYPRLLWVVKGGSLEGIKDMFETEISEEEAKAYLEYTAFSYKGLIEQLEFEGFTSEEAIYGAEQAYK